MIIDDNHPAGQERSEQFWTDELANNKILLHEIEKAILTLTKTGVTEYTLDTGQTRQTVKRADLASLIQQRDAILLIIDVLESRLGIRGGSVRRIIPRF